MTNNNVWWPSADEYNPQISKEKWIELLNNPKIFDNNSLCLMRRMLDFGGEASCSDLASKYGKTVMFYVSIEKSLASRIQKAIECPYHFENGKEIRYPILFLGRSVAKNLDENDGTYIWKLRPELEDALKTVDLSKYELFSTTGVKHSASYEWVDFYEELSEHLLLYKDNRQELVDFIYQDIKEYTTYIHYKNKAEVNDIDPFSFFAIFNRSISLENRKDILDKIKTKFQLKSNVPNGFEGIPILNNMRSFYYHWESEDALKQSCDSLWDAFAKFMENSPLTDFFNKFNFKSRQAELTIPLFWIKPNQFLALDSKNKNYLKQYGVTIEKQQSYEDYSTLLQEISSKMNSNEIKEKSFPELSFNAYQSTNNANSNMDNNLILKYKNLLSSNYNLILTGAPGTGKTYLAKQIAQQLIFEETKAKLNDEEQKQFDEQCGLVQFHPSYDYTDFVEGLRPKTEINGNVGFERKDGVFKEFCKKATKNWIDSKKSTDILQKEYDNKELIDSFLSNAINKETIYQTKNGTEFYIADFNDDVISIKILRNKTRDNINIDININKHKLDKLLENDVPLNNVKDIKQYFGYTNSQHRDSYIFTICNEISNLPKVKRVQVNPIVCKNYVFIIDEINRGEISKIFGEGFFSIDPSYRGTNGKVKTQYQNLIDSEDEFFDGFYIPENVYIIGTMNDIDRSVESMDFAFRRRFAFYEIKAGENVGMLNDLDSSVKEDAINRMNNLNKTISEIEGLSSAYHIGASYFLKLKNYTNDFDQLWNYHIEGLLREYLRGNPDVENLMIKLKSAYDNGNKE